MSDEEDDAQRHPDQLLAGERGVVGQVEPVDDGQAQAVERGDDREQHRVGVRRGDPDHDVGRDDQGGQPAGVPDHVGGDGPLDAEADGGVGARADGQREDEQEQLRAPPTAVHEAEECSGLRHQVPAAPPGSATRFSTVERADDRSPEPMPSSTWPRSYSLRSLISRSVTSYGEDRSTPGRSALTPR